MKRLCVFCGSNVGARPAYAEAAKALGGELARRGLGLVYGGGKVGLMGVIADAVLAGGGEVIGVIPQQLMDRELGHQGVTELRVVQSMHQRKAMMEQLADGFVAMPGGMGTLEELSEIFTWAQLGIHAKPFGLLDVERYYAGLVGFFDHAVAEGFIATHHRGLLTVESDPTKLVEALLAARPAVEPRWMDRQKT